MLQDAGATMTMEAWAPDEGSGTYSHPWTASPTRMLSTGGPRIKFNKNKFCVLKYVYYLYFKSLKDETPLVFSILGALG